MKRMIYLLVFVITLSNAFSQEKLYQNAFSLSDVELLDGPFKHACDLNVETLLAYDVDRLLAPFLKEAGLTPKGASFANWIDLDGHVGGHYLSALAIHYAATGDQRLKTRMDYVISELRRCQNKNGNGYVGGVKNGNTLWNQIKSGDIRSSGFDLNGSWVPFYNLHKTYAGLRDAWNYGGSDEAKTMFINLCDWGLTILNTMNDSQMENVLVTEFGGMGEVYADAYQITGNVKYLNASKRFAHKVIFDSMKNRVDNLDNRHANTQVPKAVSYQRIAELAIEPNFDTAAKFFWETVVGNRSLAFGGNSRNEHFAPKDKCNEYVESVQGPETCNTYNMLKLTEGLFRMNHDAKYADYYERAMLNHILSTQHPEHGGYVYFTQARPRHYRVYSAINSAMWCCVGSGMENHGKYGEFIYAHTHDSLFVNLFVASKLTWKEKNVVIKQETNFPNEEKTNLSIEQATSVPFKLLLRYPSWVQQGSFKVKVNGVDQAINGTPGSYIGISRTWNTGDVVEIETPMHTTIEELPNYPQYVAIMRGPILLAARNGGTFNTNELIADDSRMGHVANGTQLPITDAPFILGSRQTVIDILNTKLQAIAGKPFHYTVPELFSRQEDKNIVLEPFYGIHDSRYINYWRAMTEDEYNDIKDDLEKKEHEKMVLEARTIDAVQPGEQQPEVDHKIQSSSSTTGFHQGEGWRDATNGGFFSYELATNQHTELSLMVRYWGNESGSRTFDIKIDNALLVTENVVGKWKKNEFVDIEYQIPSSMLEGKSYIVVKLQGHSGNVAGGVFHIRLLTPKKKDNFYLNRLIDKHESFLNLMDIGDNVGEFSQATYNTFDNQINSAKQTRDAEESTQNDFDSQILALNTYFTDFLKTVNRSADSASFHLKFNKNNLIIDASGNGIMPNYKSLAKSKQIQNYTVADLGLQNGYIDLTADAGKMLPKLTNFSVSVFVHIQEDTDISQSGNFLWNFSSSDDCGETTGKYIAYRVNKQRYAFSIGGYKNELIGIQTGTEAEKGKWKHMLYVQNNKLGSIYIDGVPVIENVEAKYAPSVIGSSSYNWIGRSPYKNDAYLKNTWIYDFKVFNRGLSTSEIAQLASEVSNLQKATLEASSVKIPSTTNSRVFGSKNLIQFENYSVGKTIRIYNLTGMLVREATISKTNDQIQILPGIYLVDGYKVAVY